MYTNIDCKSNEIAHVREFYSFNKKILYYNTN